MRVQFEQAIYDEMKTNKKIIALVADSGTGKYKDIKRDMPDRYIECGIAENNMLLVASGLSSEGFIPVVYAINNFLVYRSYEFIRNDICIDKRNVKMVGLGAGVIQNLQGPTHHTLEDISCLRALPNLTLLSPGSPKEVKNCLKTALRIEGPVYIRLAKMYETEIYEDEAPEFKVGGLNIVHQGNDMTVFSTGSITGDVYTAAKKLEREGLNIRVVNVNSLKPVDKNGILKNAMDTGKVLTVEEHSIFGGLRSIVSEILIEAEKKVEFSYLGFKDVFCTDYGWHQDLKRM